MGAAGAELQRHIVPQDGLWPAAAVMLLSSSHMLCILVDLLQMAGPGGPRMADKSPSQPAGIGWNLWTCGSNSAH